MVVVLGVAVAGAVAERVGVLVRVRVEAACTMAVRSADENGRVGTESWKCESFRQKSIGKISGRVDNHCPSLMNVGPAADSDHTNQS